MDNSDSKKMKGSVKDPVIKKASNALASKKTRVRKQEAIKILKDILIVHKEMIQEYDRLLGFPSYSSKISGSKIADWKTKVDTLEKDLVVKGPRQERNGDANDVSD